MKTGIRKEDKSIFERRVPFIPKHIKELREKGFDIRGPVKPPKAFTDQEFKDLGIPVVDNLDDCDIHIRYQANFQIIFQARIRSM